MSPRQEEQYRRENLIITELDEQLEYLCSILSGHVLSAKSQLATDDSFFVYLRLNMDKNYGGNYLPISEKDMRYYVPKINSAFNIDIVQDIEYLAKPKPIYHKSEYLGQKFTWNLGYDKNYFKLKIKVDI